jgi:FKBP-type peptidyl-prolyl cis-trans isomerase FklB
MRRSWVVSFGFAVLVACTGPQGNTGETQEPPAALAPGEADGEQPAPQPAPRPQDNAAGAPAQDRAQDPAAQAPAQPPVQAEPQGQAEGGTPAGAAAADSASPEVQAGAAAGQGPVELESKAAKVSYSIGLDIGHNLKRQSIEVDVRALARGIEDAMSGAEPLMTEEEVAATMKAFQQEMSMKQSERAREQAEKNQKEGEAFLEQNKTAEGVVTLPSGLQYKVLAEGSGPSPGPTDTVSVHYRGTLLDGTEFDSSHKRGQPASFPVNGVIRGWTEALQLMKPGAKWQLFIPSELAYGERGAGGDIGPNATLIFEVELLEAKDR